MTKTMKLFLTRTEIKMYNFILYIHIYHIILLLFLPAIPGILSLYIFIKEKNLKNHFHNCFEIWAKLTTMTILTFTFILSFNWFIMNFTFDSSLKEKIMEIFIGLLSIIFMTINFAYLRDLTTFRLEIERQMSGIMYLKDKRRKEKIRNERKVSFENQDKV